MAHATSEIIMIALLLCEMGFSVPLPMHLYCDIQAALHVASNLIYQMTKSSIVDYRLVWERISSKQIPLTYVHSNNQFYDFLTKAQGISHLTSTIDKLGIYDICAQTWRGE